MDLAAALVWAGGATGVAVALYGVWILLTGRIPERTRRAFRRVTDAGMYAICIGSALALFAAASRFARLGNAWQIALGCLAVLLVVLGFVKYRPGRGTESAKYWEP